jgi:hypothetical protein
MGEESESGEAMFGEARVGGEAEAGAEVKAGGEAEASGTGGAVDARFKADRVNAAFMGLAQGPGWAAVAGDAVGCLCLGGAATSEGRVWCGGGGNERLGEGGGGGAGSRIFLQLLLVPPGPRTPSLKLRLRRALICFSDQPSSAHPPIHTPSCPRPS